MAQLAIKGHATRGKEVIEILTMLGGKTHTTLCGNLIFRGYYIGLDGFIDYKYHSVFSNSILYSLEEFLKKFPYRVGDRVKVCGDNLGIIIGMRWESGYVVYKVKLTKNGYETSKTSENLQPYEEIPTYLNRKVNEQAEKIKEVLEPAKEIIEGVYAYNEINCYHQDFGDKVRIRLGNDFEIKVEDNKTYIVKKQPQYPKTYNECCKIIGFCSDTLKWDNPFCINIDSHPYIKHLDNLIESFCKLIICRDAYWKIAGEEMGLGKPWEPDWEKADERKYCIVNTEGNVAKWVQKTTNKILAFPTEEMRDAFYENFKELIELCKELL
jgi:hypothetical protein